MQDLEAAVVALKAKAVQRKFDDTFINGDTAIDTKAFDGIDKQCSVGQTASMGTNGATLTLAKLDETIDLIRGGKPDILLMSRRTRRGLTALARASGSGVIEQDRDEFGRMVQFYDGVPIGVNDYISDAKTVGTSSDCSTIYALQFGEGALVGLTGPGGLTDRTRRLPRDEGRHPRAREVVRLDGALQPAQAVAAHRHPPVIAEKQKNKEQIRGQRPAEAPPWT